MHMQLYVYSLSPFMYTSLCTAPVSQSAPGLTSTDLHEPTAKQQTMEASHSQSKSLVFLPIICGTCCRAPSCKCTLKNAQYTCMCILARYTSLPTCAIFIVSIISYTLYSPSPPPYTNDERAAPHGQAASNRVTTSSV